MERMDPELKAYLDDMKGELRAHVSEECYKVETKLLHAFHGWARAMEIRVRGIGGLTIGFDERLTMIEERVGELERRKAS